MKYPREPIRPHVRESNDYSIMLSMREPSEQVKVKVANKPVLPSREEVRTHNPTHQPCRSWCRRCVRGKADEIKHTRGDGERIHLVV